MSGFVTALVQLWLELPALLGYLKGQTFYKPLSREEEEEVINRFIKGDESARVELIERNMRLVAHVVKKFHPSHDLLDDYISIGTIGLMKAVSSFTPEKKTRLATYAARCIENEILMHLRAQKKVQKDVSLFEPIGIDKDGQSLQIRDLLQLDEPSTIEKIERQEDFAQLYRYLDTLDPRELEIISYRYGLQNFDPHTQKEIAKRLNISRSYVSRIEKRALIKLYQQFKHGEKE
ncbi:RNA polymerase sporulation-specific sigma factor [Solibacillus kalamii]|uniref:DNA-directed RNA polymerase specialized sigma subunit n=3 Tax=Solibacillus TaxID=648800 RepID=F2F3J2_SOLSS|nr:MULTISPECIES: RNA polymerase sporulation sigma factor SigK [Solibacillus]AMO86133.1 RNA polymerase subunit sigma-70 [Solibacillus silvestris]EKB44218.1 RNA polymerase sigma-28 factor precursor [Solibacillus isronensis B3W22]MBM7664376.1 RNA polymerase sporulation-specific sigma factor [Solibacillus kalamii]OBW59919.1 RNA polymerase subunit sigma-70 [Solibacillus silvestris]OUZ39863.1 RNA polymerase sporulation sigma factor SigK [Solibacillus kalamii]